MDAQAIRMIVGTSIIVSFIVMAGVIAARGKTGWGWFLLMAFLALPLVTRP